MTSPAVAGVASLADAGVASLAVAGVASSADVAEVASSADLVGNVAGGVTFLADPVSMVTSEMIGIGMVLGMVWVTIMITIVMIDYFDYDEPDDFDGCPDVYGLIGADEYELCHDLHGNMPV